MPSKYPNLSSVTMTSARVIDVGEQRRFFTGALRRAIEVRDRHCRDETCDVEAGLCECDHVVPWSEGGPTTQQNGRLACPFHNRPDRRP